MEHVHILLVGTSLIRNASRIISNLGGGKLKLPKEVLEAYSRLRKEDIEKLTRWSRVIDDEEARYPPRTIRMFLEAYAITMPKQASAELNSLLTFTDVTGEPVDRVILVRTSTNICNLVANILRSILPKFNIKVDSREIVIGIFEVEESIYTGLAELLVKIYEVCKAEVKRHNIVYLNATAGFKPESAIALMAASLAGIQAAYYMHEADRKIRIIPIPPLKPDKEYIHEIFTLEGKTATILDKKPELKFYYESIEGRLKIKEPIKRFLEDILSKFTFKPTSPP